MSEIQITHTITMTCYGSTKLEEFEKFINEAKRLTAETGGVANLSLTQHKADPRDPRESDSITLTARVTQRKGR